MQTTLLRVGTRGSPLALTQAREIMALLRAAHGWDEGVAEIVPMRTSGDSIVDRSLSDAGGKGLFTKEIEEALLDGRIDLAVHSAKDMATALPTGLTIAATPPREDFRDAFLSPRAAALSELPRGAVLGTSSLRRKAICLMMRPDLKVVEFRGNVATRLRKLAEGVADATLLAIAGLKRLGLADKATGILEPPDFLPAVGQGVIAVETREADDSTRELLAPINDPATEICLRAERAFLAALDGSCRTPIGGLAQLAGRDVSFSGMIVKPDGRQSHRVQRKASPLDAERIGREAGEELARRAGPHFFEGD